MAEQPLRTRVIAALAQDKRTRHLSIDVSVIGAQVTLIGNVANVKDRQAAEQVTRSVSGVAGVLNETRIGRLA